MDKYDEDEKLKIIQKIREIINDRSVDDDECLMKIQKLMRLLERCGGEPFLIKSKCDIQIAQNGN